MHGGDIYRNEVELDFSVNVNPLGIPERVQKALQEAVKDCGCYPDIYYEGLKRAIHEMTGADEQSILCANGASELFPAVLRAIGSSEAGRTQNVLLPVPSFSGYERAVRAQGGTAVYYQMKKENGFCLDRGILPALSEGVDVLILANPNNPVGNLIEQDLMEDILRVCYDRKIWLLLDECFIEFTDMWESCSLLGRIRELPDIMVIRSFTKSFAIPGVRLGYMVCGDPYMLQKIEMQLPEWNLSVFAQKAGAAAAAEKAYLERGRHLVKTEREYLRQELQKLGFTVYSGAANYLLFYTQYPAAQELKKNKILIRDCSDYRGLGAGYYRIAVRKREENERLLRALRDMVCR